MRDTTTSKRTVFTRMRSPLGRLFLLGEIEDEGLVLSSICFETLPLPPVPEGAREDARAFAEVRAELDAYFAGERTAFDLALRPRGTAFQRAVWRALTKIPYGETTTYGAIARAIRRPRAVRAVGAAIGHNPLPIVVPCHRVIGRDGSLTGYTGGLDKKRVLLAIESPQKTLGVARGRSTRRAR